MLYFRKKKSVNNVINRMINFTGKKWQVACQLFSWPICYKQLLNFFFFFVIPQIFSLFSSLIQIFCRNARLYRMSSSLFTYIIHGSRMYVWYLFSQHYIYTCKSTYTHIPLSSISAIQCHWILKIWRRLDYLTTNIQIPVNLSLPSFFSKFYTEAVCWEFFFSFAYASRGLQKRSKRTRNVFADINQNRQSK